MKKRLRKMNVLSVPLKPKKLKGNMPLTMESNNSNDYAQNYNIDFGEVICNSCKEKVNAWGGSINYRTPEIPINN
jgi:hypothetical protein